MQRPVSIFEPKFLHQALSLFWGAGKEDGGKVQKTGRPQKEQGDTVPQGESMKLISGTMPSHS